jgi:site-specific DNA recombinase
MTRTGTRRADHFYDYYSCGGCQKKGKSVCRGSHVPMRKLDDLIIANVKERLFTPDRLAAVLEARVERQGLKDQAVQDRRSELQGELILKQDKLTRLRRAIENGIVEINIPCKPLISMVGAQGLEPWTR